MLYIKNLTLGIDSSWVKPVNANFLVEINSSGVEVYAYGSSRNDSKEFKLYAPSYNEYYSTEYNSSSILEVINSNEKELLKRMYVKVSDCPL